MSSAALREDLRLFLGEQGLDLPADADDSVPLFGEGRLDSRALFNLVLWIEERIGSPVDPTAFDLALEWGSIGKILAFLAAHTRRSR
jgi:acyl carrier protein